MKRIDPQNVPRISGNEHASGQIAEGNFIMRPSAGRGAFWRRARKAMVLACILAISACAMVRVGYNNADTLALIWLNRYADLDSTQEAFARERIKRYLVWHRTTQLPDYARHFASVRQRFGDRPAATRPLTAADVETVATEVRARIDTAVEHALPDIADLALTLRPEQIRAIEKRFVKAGDSFRDEYLSDNLARQREARGDRIVTRAKEWFGKLNDEQMALIDRATNEMPLRNEYRLEERVARQANLLDLLRRVQREKPARDVVIGWLRTYADNFEVSADAGRRLYFADVRSHSAELTAALVNAAGPEQRERALKRMQWWIETFNQLAAQPS